MPNSKLDSADQQLLLQKKAVTGLELTTLQRLRKKTAEQFTHPTITSGDSFFLISQTMGDTISTTTKVVSLIGKVLSNSWEMVLGIGDPIMMLSIGARAALGLARAVIHKDTVKQYYTRIGTSFAIIGTAAVALTIVFGALVAPFFTVPVLLFGAAGLGFYNDQYGYIMRRRELIKSQALLKETEKSLQQLTSEMHSANHISLELIDKLSDDKTLTDYEEKIQKALKAGEAIKANSTFNELYKNKINLGSEALTLKHLKATQYVRIFAMVGIALMIPGFFIPPLAIVGFAMFIISGIANGIYRIKENNNQATKNKALQDTSAAGKYFADLTQEQEDTRHINELISVSRPSKGSIKLVSEVEVLEDSTRSVTPTSKSFLLSSSSPSDLSLSSEEGEGEGEGKAPHRKIKSSKLL